MTAATQTGFEAPYEVLVAELTADGRGLSPEESDAAPLTAAVEYPQDVVIPLVDAPRAHFSGWVASRSHRRPTVEVVTGDRRIPFGASDPRPEAFLVFGSRYDLRDDRIGFQFYVDLPDPPEEGLPVVLEFSDGQYLVRSRTYTVRWASTEVLAHYEERPPDVTNGLAAFAGRWDSRFPGDLARLTGGYEGFNDPRINRGIAVLGGVEGFRVLELGPWEGGHTWMLEQRGAAEVLGIEANSRGYLKCLVTQQALGLTRSRFLCGDFAPYLRDTDDRFDLVVACGVLYHQVEPAQVLADLGRITDRVILWTHYFDQDLIERSPVLRPRFGADAVERTVGDHTYTLHPHQYGAERGVGDFCGGPRRVSNWLERDALLDGLAAAGFVNQEVDPEYDRPDHPNGPALLVTAWQ